MNTINVTLTFADEIQKEAINWMKKTYIPLLERCPHINSVELFSIETQEGTDKSYALQLRFLNRKKVTDFKKKFEKDLDLILYAKFDNQFGMFKTTLFSI